MFMFGVSFVFLVGIDMLCFDTSFVDASRSGANERGAKSIRKGKSEYLTKNDDDDKQCKRSAVKRKKKRRIERAREEVLKGRREIGMRPGGWLQGLAKELKSEKQGQQIGSSKDRIASGHLH